MTDSLEMARTHQPASQLVRYGLVGIASNLAGYIVYLIVTYFGVGPKITMTLLYVVGATFGFIGNRQWAFAHKGKMLESGIRYLVAHLGGYLLNLNLLLTFADDLGYPHQWVQGGAIIIVAVFLFFAFRYFVFPKTTSEVVDKK